MGIWNATCLSKPTNVKEREPMKADDIRSLNEKMQEKMLNTKSVAEHEAGFNSLALSLFTEMAAQLAEANENQHSLRDQFAMAAMQALLVGKSALDRNQLAIDAYFYAEGMMEARKK